MAKRGVWNKNQHDIGIVNVEGDGTGTSAIGMMLAQREMRLNSKTPPYLVPIYQEFDDEYLASQFFSDPAGYGNLPPEKEIAIRQDDWRAGFGEDIFDSSDIERYFSSFGMDMRHKGRAVLGWTPTAIALPSITSVSITNADFELDANWTTGAGSPVRSSVQALSGTFSWRLAGANPAWAYQDLTFNANHVGHHFRFTFCRGGQYH